MTPKQMTHMRLDTTLLAKIDHAAAEWTLNEIKTEESPVRHTRSSVVREAVQHYLSLKERPGRT